MEEKRYDPYTGEEIKQPAEEECIQEETEAGSAAEAEQNQNQTASSDTIVVGESGYYYQENRQADYRYQGGQTGGPHIRVRKSRLKTTMQRSLLYLESWR